jgi:hypothetical protein
MLVSMKLCFLQQTSKFNKLLQVKASFVTILVVNWSVGARESRHIYMQLVCPFNVMNVLLEVHDYFETSDWRLIGRQ